MDAIPIRALHVEDDTIQRRLMVHHLKLLPEFTFQVEAAASEEEALVKFGQGGFGLVLLDYQLKEGDGLSCLRRIRQLDGMVPIIAVSATADPDIAARLVNCGADDFLDKSNLDPNGLRSSVRASLQRVKHLRQRLTPRRVLDPETELAAMVSHFLRALPAGFAGRLGKLANACRERALEEKDLLDMFRRVGARDTGAGEDGEIILRFLLGEMLARLFPGGQTE